MPAFLLQESVHVNRTNGLPIMSNSSSLLPSLPDEARVWMYPSADSLPEETQTTLLDRLETFVDRWTSHDQTVHGGAAVLYDRFVLLAGIRTDGKDPSGCAIDDATHAVDATADDLGIEWVSSLHVIYRKNNDTLAAVPRSTFQNRVQNGNVTTETCVFDLSVTTLEEVRRGAFEQPAGQSWHAKAFPLLEPA